MVLEDMRDLLLGANSDSPSSPGQLFKPIQTLPVVGLLLLVDYYPPVDSLGNHQPSLYAVLLYLQISFWILTVVADQVMARKHQKSQLRGYLEFNRKIVPCLRAFPITVTSCSIFLLTIAAIAWDYCPSREGGTCGWVAPLTPSNYVQVVLSLQAAILLPVTLAYSIRVHQFNTQRSLPDIFEGQMVYSLSRSLPTFEDVGIRETTDDTLLEKQAEAIHFLKEHNARLSRKILRLTDELGRYSTATDTSANV